MKVELSKKDIVNLLRGVEPSHDTMKKAIDMGLGIYVGGFEDKFVWEYPNYHLWYNYSEEELFDLYLKITKEK